MLSGKAIASLSFDAEVRKELGAQVSCSKAEGINASFPEIRIRGYRDRNET